MRAIYHIDADENIKCLRDSKTLHHLLKVLRIRVGQNLLLLNGKGISFLYNVIEIKKNEIQIDFVKRNSSPNQDIQIDLLQFATKRDSLELIIRQATELGVKNIFLSESDFSQRLSSLNLERMNKIMISGLEQSNNLYLPQLSLVKNFKDICNSYDLVVFLTTQGTSHGQISEKMTRQARTLLVIGPEGGFQDEESDYFRGLAHAVSLNLPTPILRASTAVPAAYGVVLSEWMKAASKL